MNTDLFDFIEKSPSAFHAVSNAAGLLCSLGYKHLSESDEWKIECGKGYFVTRNSSSLIAFRVPENFTGFMMSAAHSDSPSFKIKENAEIKDNNFTRLSVEKYGGMLMSQWLDRPLSIAGRVVVRTGHGAKTMLADSKEPCCIIPSVAIHLTRGSADGAKYDPAVDMLPIWSSASFSSFNEFAASLAGCRSDDILSSDLFLYNPQKGVEIGDFISSPRLDDLQCAFASLVAFTKAKESASAPVYCLFDNEEVGSTTKQGAASTFLYDVLTRIASSLGLSAEELRIKLSSSFLVSCDNAHSVHPNHPELADKNHAPVMNEGIVIKYNAGQRYTTDAVSAGIFKLICEAAEVPVSLYANRADLPGGSTLGNIANTVVSLNTVDIGLAQLSMHSSFETAGKNDTEYLERALEKYFSSSIKMLCDGSYEVK